MLFAGLWRDLRRRLARAGGAVPDAPAGSAAASEVLALDADFLQAVQAFALQVARAHKGGRLADQRSTARGQGSDFVDHRPYVAGDDLRSVDWHIQRRLGLTMVRVYEEPQDLPVHLLLDTSGSLLADGAQRWHAAQRVTLALAAVALNQRAVVTLEPVGPGAAPPPRPVSGAHRLGLLAGQLVALQPQGETTLVDALRRFAAVRRRRGLLIAVTDAFVPQGVDALADALLAVPHAVLLVQVRRTWDADPALDPRLQGDVQIADGETAALTALSLTPELLARYRETYRDFDQRLQQALDQRRGLRLCLDADQPVLPQLAPLLACGGLVL